MGKKSKQLTVMLPAGLANRLDILVLARRRADGPGSKLNRSRVIADIIERVLATEQVPDDLAARLMEAT